MKKANTIETTCRCKQCSHYEVCEADERNLPDYIECNFYDDKLNNVNYLHSLLGKTVYSYCEVLGGVLSYQIESLHTTYLGEDKFCYHFEAFASKDGELLDSIEFEPEDINDFIFFSQKVACRALKEWGTT